ncbi:MAG: hypothetical protein IPM71_12365 [Bacteroidota bacterium]|nr:MAG: hypothetical protein IPM71_12365 [Bacteroidota bacterium]
MGFLDRLRRYDYFWLGIALGLLIPLLLYPILRPLDPKNLGFIAVDQKQIVLKMLPMLLSRCIFPNALIFFLFIWNDMNLLAKGVLYSTLFLTGALILIQFIF